MFGGESYTESYPAVRASIPAARAALTEFAADAGARGERLEAIRLSVSEAITNVVLHAYPDPGADGQKTVQVTASRVEDDVWILVADDGAGLRPGSDSAGLGLGLALISQLADDLQVVNRGGGGTELRMRFRLRVGQGSADAQPRGSAASAAAAA